MTAILHNLIYNGVTKKSTRLEFLIIKNSNILVLALIPLTLILCLVGVLGSNKISNYLLLFLFVLVWSVSILISNYKAQTVLLKHILYVGVVSIVLLASFYFGFNLGFNLFFIVISIIPFVLFYDKIAHYGYFSIAFFSFLFSLSYAHFQLELINRQTFSIFLSNSLLAFAIQLLNVFLFKTKLTDYAESAILHKNEINILNDFFAKRLKEKTSYLAKENDKLLNLNEAAKSYAYHVSHDLKEPLKNIISFIGIAEKKLGKIENKELKKELSHYTKFVSIAARRLDIFVSEVLKFSLIENDTAIQFEEIDLNRSVRHVILGLNDLMSKAKVEINYNLPTKIKANPIQIEVLFQNLISNSIKYRLKHSSPLINIRYIEKENNFEFMYTDNGRGIPENEKELIFEAFKVSSFNKKTDSSTGLGLSICKRILSWHKGDIWIHQTKKNKGSEFHFTISKNLDQEVDQNNLAA